MSITTGTEGESVTPANPASDTVAQTTDVTALLERRTALSAPVLRAAVDRLAPPMDTVAAYHFGWIDAEGRPSDGDGGKAVRPALALLSAEVAGAPSEAGIPGAVAVELVHNFSLLHDDLMDGDEQRRHRDTVWKVHGPAQAILVGDALFALAYDVLLELGTVEAGRAARRLTSATRKLIDGQAQDISYEHRERVTVEECLEMEGNKTGALLACAVSIGAVLGGADNRTRRHPGGVRLPRLGLAFQAVDDLLGIWGDPEATGKQTWSDLRQRKKSLGRRRARRGRPHLERLGELLRPTPRAATSTASPKRSSPPARRSSRRRAAASGPPRKPVVSTRSPSRRCTRSNMRTRYGSSSPRSRTSWWCGRDDQHAYMTRSRRPTP
ncbi:hypothetical protein SMICM304S_09552 [Streptomyces microflavus]